MTKPRPHATALALALAAAVSFSALLLPSALPAAEDEAAIVARPNAVLDAYRGKPGELREPGERRLHLVYFTPADKEPAPDWEARVRRTMADIRDFYAAEMERLGFGKRTIKLDEPDGAIRLHLVKGEADYADYSGNDYQRIRREAKPVLAAAGIDAEKETVLIFCNLSEYDGKSIKQKSPYYAYGTHRGGTGWLSDSPLLDPDLLSKKEPMVRDGQYGRISVGRYNSIFVGGTAHEPYHALSLPHNRERPDEAARGTALMGSGNRTYGEDRRGEGKGSFLTLAHGLRLASHPMFSGSIKGMDAPAKAEVNDLRVAAQGKGFVASGRVTADPPAYAVVAYMDPAGGGDYDATTRATAPDAGGRFALQCDALAPGKAAQLRLVVCHANGATSTFRYPYAVGNDGAPDLTTLDVRQSLAPLIAAARRRDRAGFDAARKSLGAGAEEAHAKWIAALAGTFDRQPPQPAPAQIAAAVNSVSLADAAPSSAKVGWLRPMRNAVPSDDVLLQAGGRPYAAGLYAHAPSAYAFDLGGAWKTLRGEAGLQDGSNGSVVFVIRADGNEIWRSKALREGTVERFEVSVEGAAKLELATEDAGDGNGSDWGIWLEPSLAR